MLYLIANRENQIPMPKPLTSVNAREAGPAGQMVAVVQIERTLIDERQQELETALGTLTGAGATRIVVDGERAASISAESFGVLLETARKLRQGGGDLKLSNLSPGVLRTLKRTYLNRHFDIWPTNELAIAAFQNGAAAVREWPTPTEPDIHGGGSPA